MKPGAVTPAGRDNRVVGGCGLPEPFCYPTLPSPLPPSYEEGAPRRRRVRFIATVPKTHPLLPLLGRGGAKRRGGSVIPFPAASATLNGLEYPAAAAAPLFPNMGQGKWGRPPGRPAHRPLTRFNQRRTGRCPQRPFFVNRRLEPPGHATWHGRTHGSAPTALIERNSKL